MLHYTLTPLPHAHQWQITLSFSQEESDMLVLSLPNWVPGSYLIRDFSRHIIEISARCHGQPARIVQTAKNIWETEARAGNWEISYTVYAHDLSVRGSFLSPERGFFDGACLFLKIAGQENTQHRITLNRLPTHWLTATTLPHLGGHIYQTASYAELIDHPVELGSLETIAFEAFGIPHRIVLSGHYRNFDRGRLKDDVRKICETALQMFPTPAPFAEYLFLLHIGDNLYGGLEHRSSTALLAGRDSLPPLHMDDADEKYTELLGLFSHEYFHAWNVKSIKPALFEPYSLDSETYTEQLWAFEGITSYYDDLLLARSRVITPETYLNLLAKTITRVQQGKGRLKQTLAQSSFTAWNKFYRQDENSPNAIVSYYQKGALAALCLDLLIRRQRQGSASLDTVLQEMYRKWCENGQGIPEQEWQQQCQRITGTRLEDFFQTALYSTDDLPLRECLAQAGIELQWQPLPRNHGGGLTADTVTLKPASDFGARYKQNDDSITLTHVFNGGSAEAAGLSPQDRIIALDGFACTDFAARFQAFEPGDSVSVHYFRHGYLHSTTLTVQAAEADTALLRIADRALFEQWLYGQTARFVHQISKTPIPEAVRQWIDYPVVVEAPAVLPQTYPDYGNFHELFQDGYRFSGLSSEDLTGNTEGAWQNGWYVIARNYYEDPFAVDFNEEAQGFPVYFCKRGRGGAWIPHPAAPTLADFTANLIAVKKLKNNPEELLDYLQNHTDPDSPLWQEARQETERQLQKMQRQQQQQQWPE